jgi:hypothetical protein
VFGSVVDSDIDLRGFVDYLALVDALECCLGGALT